MIGYYVSLRQLLRTLQSEIYSLTSEPEAQAISEAIERLIAKISRLINMMYACLQDES